MLFDVIKKDLMEAMKNKEKVRVLTLKDILSRFYNYLIENKMERTKKLTNEEVIRILQKAAKQRNESIRQYEKADRTDLIQTEKEELEIIVSYLPASMPREELKKIVQAKIIELEIKERKEISTLINSIKAENYDAIIESKNIISVLEELL